MKILQIVNYFAPHVGGIEQVARDILHSLGGAEQRVVCFHSGKENVRDEIDGVKIVRAGTFCKISSQSLSLSFGKILKEEFRQFSPDVVIFHYPNPFQARYLLKLLKKSTCKLIVWWHLDITKQKILGKFFRSQTRRLLKRAEKIVATSPNYIKGSEFLPLFEEKCVVIPNCASKDAVTADGESIRRSEEIRSRYAGKTLLFALGRHVPYKGMEYLIRASKLLGKEYAVFIGGEGPLTDSLKELSKGDEKVVFLGKIDDVSRKAYMLACDIFCFPSITKNEAFGLALAEAMSFGKPAVTFTVEGSGINYVSLNGVTGIEVQSRDAEEYAQAIESLSADEERRKEYGAAAKKRAEELFSEEVFKKNVRSLLSL